jgi:hypothetical protein
MTEDKEIHPAFPTGNIREGTYGMTLRDYFAAKAMEGFCSSNQANLFNNQHHLTQGAYRIADAMMEARK